MNLAGKSKAYRYISSLMGLSLVLVLVLGLAGVSQAASGTLDEMIVVLQTSGFTDADLVKLNANRDAVLANPSVKLDQLQLAGGPALLAQGWDDDQMRFALRLAMRPDVDTLLQDLTKISDQYTTEITEILIGADTEEILAFLIDVDVELTGQEFSDTAELKVALGYAFMGNLGNYPLLNEVFNNYLTSQEIDIFQLLVQPTLLPGYDFYKSLINTDSYLLQEPVNDGGSGGGGILPPLPVQLPPGSQLVQNTEPTTVVGAGGAIKLDFPAAALIVPEGQQAVVVVDQLDEQAAALAIKEANPVPDWRGLGPIFRLQLRVGTPGAEQAVTTLEKPVDIELSFAGLDLQGLDPGSLDIFRIPDEGGSMHAQGGRLDRQRQVIRAQVKGFSSFTLGYQERSFTDMEEHWARQDVLALAARGVVNGVAAGSFAPNATITRAELAALLVRALNVPVKTVAASRFSDVAAGAWYATEVEAAAEAGLVAGYPDGSFAPNATVTRLELAVMLGRALRASHLGWDTAAVEAALVQFADAGLVPAWARADAALTVNKQIIRGLPGGLLSPAGLCTRAEAAVMLWRLMQQDQT